jgi:hypothetical protein
VGAQLLLGRRDLRDALAYYDEALRRGADALDLARDRWSCAMLLGDFEAAWRISDQVLAERRRRGLACVDQPLHLRWVWDGRPLTDRNVLVRCHHGLGDVIQFIRLAAPLRATAARVTVQAVPELLPLIDGVAGIDAMIPLGATDPPYDIDIELLELPHALRFRLDGIPARVPYISVPDELARRHRVALEAHPGFRVGLVWAAGAWRPERSVPLRLVSPLAAIPGVELVSLQQGAALGELGDVDILQLPDATTDLVAAAATLRALDLVISVDTMIAHLAGALGVPCWTLLHFHADWRWMIGRADSPWYPTMRLFRQPAPGEWTPVIQQIAAALQDRVRDAGAG